EDRGTSLSSLPEAPGEGRAQPAAIGQDQPAPRPLRLSGGPSLPVATRPFDDVGELRELLGALGYGGDPGGRRRRDRPPVLEPEALPLPGIGRQAYDPAPGREAARPVHRVAEAV